MDKKQLSEADIRSKFIDPAILKAGWSEANQIYREYAITNGRIVVRGQRAQRNMQTALRADYLLCWQYGQPLAVVEAKDNNHTVGAGLQQATDYAERMGVPFAFSSNGDGFVFRDATLADGVLTQEIGLDKFPSPEDLWDRYCAWKQWTPEQKQVNAFAYHQGDNGRVPRYYQLHAINRTLEAVAAGQNRVLLVMATGTGKTYTAFQIIWRLLKSGAKKRVLFLADRNILVDQTMVGDFKPFKGGMAKLSPNAKGIERVDAQGVKTVEELELAVTKGKKSTGGKQVNKAYEVYLGLYQAVTGKNGADDVYKQFSPDFFDLIIIDECHRGSANEDSAWREILDYFSNATQVGLTATPKETEDASNIHYFGEPVYTYTLKQGIEDGFLAPYKVVRVDLDRDTFGWRPPKGMLDDNGHLIEDRIYNAADMNRNLVLGLRDRVVADKITQYLKGTDRNAKTIVFCEDVDHAQRMTAALAEANKDICATRHKYVMQITGDNEVGKRELDNFIDPDSADPVIAVTSKLMSTGVDAQTCKLVVLDQNIKSMTLFKQIIGRGTRLNEEHGKQFFTILDFKRATELFADKDFDGEPVQIYKPTGDDDVVPPPPADDESVVPDGDNGLPDTGGEGQGGKTKDPAGVYGDGAGENGSENTGGGGGTDKPRKYEIGGRVTVSIARERIQYLDANGKLVTESLRDFTRINLAKKYDSLDAFLQAWTGADRKEALVQELQHHGVLLDVLAEELALEKGEGTTLAEADPFDVLLHVAYDQPILTRSERARRAKQKLADDGVYAKYGNTARKVLEALIDKYADEGIFAIENTDILKVQPFTQMGSNVELMKSFGGSRQDYQAAMTQLAQAIYQPPAA
ncbi:DEAD/DEAH box helicase family protein [Comamonas sp. Y6]|uniref:DEAD/DEAH box helicase family protein n=1 Tax=Comamonas resistens TaxID=3046670 RepID=A0ABY8SVH1_9BURK|nr:DEAD/DEAH box helicase family protein [Comamonas resistens]MDL5036729.1 DEAD/DEAH box helicase family protein [Comamonas resistens]WHS67042.1 DEAD/DEAH box helicase family protein [Comamonas resistens]